MTTTMKGNWVFVAGKVLESISIIFLPKVAVFVTFTFFNSLGWQLAWGSLAVVLAAEMLGFVIIYQDDEAFGNSLAMMLSVYSAICVTSGVVSDAPSYTGIVLGGAACVAIVLVRLKWKPKGESVWRVLSRFDAVRYSAVVFLFTWLHVASDRNFTRFGWVLTVFLMLWPVVLNWFPAYTGFSARVEKGKTILGTTRWILAFVVGGNLIAGLVTGSQLAWVFLILAGFAYLVVSWFETPDDGVFTDEICSVAASSTATTLHILLTDIELVQHLGFGYQVALVGFGLLCIAMVTRFRLGKKISWSL